jgi:hypothetical protein
MKFKQHLHLWDAVVSFYNSTILHEYDNILNAHLYRYKENIELNPF